MSLGQSVALLATGGKPSVQQYVDKWAKVFGVDPIAAMKVSHVEGGGKWGAVGDQGTSFGPWQLHIGGAMPRQYSTPTAAAAFANSEEGVKYVLQQMGKVAGGLTGNAAIAAIVRKFERPANPDAEIARALGVNVAASPLSAAGGAVPGATAMGLPTTSRPGFSDSLKQSLASMMNPQGDAGADILAQTLARQKSFRERMLTETQRPAQVPGQDLSSPYGGQMMPGAAPGGRVSVARGADRAGASLQQGVLDFAAQIAGVYGQPLNITTGTNHNRFVAGTQRESAHWTGNAADIAASGDNLTRMGRAALIAAGMPPAEAARVKGGLFNMPSGYQIIFNTNEGGNHWNHLHVGLRGGEG